MKHPLLSPILQLYLKNTLLLNDKIAIQCQTFSSITPMLGDCFCSAYTKRTINNRCKFYKLITTRLAPEQISLLALIFDDLATRNSQNQISYENFLNFYSLTGLWASELFRLFDEDHTDFIAFEEFLYGISLTIKASSEQKIKLLYTFFQDDLKQGIEFKNFVKMLYNYAKDELKEILRDDLTTTITNTHLIGSETCLPCEKKIYEMISQPKLQKKQVTAFDQAYQTLIKVHDQGTYLEINENSLNYKIKYNNMSTHVKAFAESVYEQFGVDVCQNEKARLSFDQFQAWIKCHKKLYKSFFSYFHTEIWATNYGQPNYLNAKIDLQFVGKIQCGKFKSQVYGFQIEDIIVFCESIKNKRKPIKIICLEGLTIRDRGNLSIEISHRSDFYKNCLITFRKPEQHQEWMESLSKYQKESLNLNYIIGEVIGTGKFSTVYKCINKTSKKIYALKAVDLSKLSKNGSNTIRNESQILKIVNHPQILKHHETIYTRTHEYIITEYIYGQDLFEYVRKRSCLNQFESAFIIGNIMKAVMYLHELDIMHRDLKPENIMIMFKEKKQTEYFECTTPELRKGQRIQNVKIIDFGLSDHVDDLEKMEKKKLLAGTPNYIAPEIILGEPITLKSDVFSIGSILYFMLRGTLPFAELNAEQTLRNTIRGHYDIQSLHWDHISLQAKDLLSKLLAVDPSQRIELKQAVNHEWFSCISNQTKTKSSASSVSDTNESLKKSLNEVDDINLLEVPLKQRKVSTSQRKYRDPQKTRQSK